MTLGLTSPIPSDFYDYLKEDEKNQPIEDKWRLYNLRKAVGQNIKQKEIEKKKIEVSKCYEKIIEILSKYVDMNEEQKKIIAVWIMGTYFHEQFNTYPYLFFNAMRGSGKTRTLKLISSLGAKGDGSVQNNLTDAVLFRIPRGTTTCIDEVEQIGHRDKQTLRELLNSAYKKGMKVKRMKKVHKDKEEKQEVEVFEPYFPIALANIWGMDEVLGDRAITLVLEKSNHQSITKMIEDFDTNTEILEIKRTLTQFSDVSDVTLPKKTYIQHWNTYICQKYNVISSSSSSTSLNIISSLEDIERDQLFNKIDEMGIHGRNLELFLPLLLTAKDIGEEVFVDILNVAKNMSHQKKEDEYQDSKDVSLFEFITHLENDLGLNYIALKELTQKFRHFVGDVEEFEDKWLNEKWLGRALKRLNLSLNKKKLSAGVQVMLNFGKAKEKLKIFKHQEEVKS